MGNSVSWPIACISTKWQTKMLLLPKKICKKENTQVKRPVKIIYRWIPDLKWYDRNLKKTGKPHFEEYERKLMDNFRKQQEELKRKNEEVRIS